MNNKKIRKSTKILIIFMVIVVIAIIVAFCIAIMSESRDNNKSNNNQTATSNSATTNTSNNITTNSTQNSLPDYISKTQNYYTFNMTITDFTNKLNEASTYNITPIEVNDFKYQGEITAENGVTLNVYLYEQINSANGAKNGKGIVLQTDPQGKIAVIRYLAKSGIFTDDVLLQRILNVSINENKDSAISIIEEAKSNVRKTITSDGLHYGYQYWTANNIPAFELFAK